MDRSAVIFVALACVVAFGSTGAPAPATTPGANGRVVFRSDRDTANGELYVRPFSGGTTVRLTNNSAYELDPEWAPDGSRVAFAMDPNLQRDIYTVDPDGQNLVRLTTDPGSDFSPTWSPDGSKIAFASDRSGTALPYIMKADGSDTQLITPTNQPIVDLEWSPDGTRFVYTTISGTQLSIHVMDADGTNQQLLTVGDFGAYRPSWSPDSTQIVYTSTRSGNLDIWAMADDGSNQHQVTQNASVDALPSWSPDGSLIGFHSSRDGDWDLWTIHPDGTNPQHVTDHVSAEVDLAWESVNRAPAPVADAVQVAFGLSVDVDVLANDTDPDGDMLTIATVTQPTEGTAGVVAPGIVRYTHSGAGSASDDRFTYQVGDGQLTTTGTVTITIGSDTRADFADVPSSHAFYGDIGWIAGSGITVGCNPPLGTLFCPDGVVTRGQMAAFLVRAMGYTDDGGGDLFVDDDGSIFEGDIDRLATAGVTLGCDPPANTSFCPDGVVTRGQMAAFLHRALE